jgi:hypothetical protein
VGASKLNVKALYPVLAILIALAFMLTPLITLAALRPERNQFLSSLTDSMKELERTGFDSNVQESPVKDIEALIVSVFIAWGLFMFFRRKSPRKRYRFMGPYPF